MYTHTQQMWVDRHDGVNRALDTSSRSSLCGRVVSRIFVSFLSSQSCRLTIGSRVQWKAGGALLGKFSCYITQLGYNTHTLGSMKTASWFWVGQLGSSAAQGSFVAARQTLRHVGESNLIWLFRISKLLFGYNLWEDVCLSEVCMCRRADVAGGKCCTGLADCCVLGLFFYSL